MKLSTIRLRSGIGAVLLAGALVATTVGCATGGGPGDNDAAPITLRVSTVSGANSPVYHELEKLADRVKERSDGALTISIFSDGQLGSTTENIQAIANGDDMIAYVDSGSIAGLVDGYGKNLNMLSGPFLFESMDEGFKFYESDVFKELADAFEDESGIQILSLNWFQGQRSMIGNKGFSSPSDMENARIRVPPIETWTRTFDLIGAVPTTIESPEIFSALEQGVVDGTDSSVGPMVSSKYYEAAKHFTRTGHFMPFYGFVINQNTMNSLPQDLRDLLKEEFEISGVNVSEEFKRDEAGYLKTMEENGVTIHEADIAAYKKVTAPFYDIYEDGLLEKFRNSVR